MNYCKGCSFEVMFDGQHAGCQIGGILYGDGLDIPPNGKGCPHSVIEKEVMSELFECIHCSEYSPDKNHWRTCESHPARIENTNLRKLVGELCDALEPIAHVMKVHSTADYEGEALEGVKALVVIAEDTLKKACKQIGEVKKDAPIWKPVDLESVENPILKDFSCPVRRCTATVDGYYSVNGGEPTYYKTGEIVQEITEGNFNIQYLGEETNHDLQMQR